MNSAHYFETARERERIRRLRDSGAPRPWTTDPIFAGFRFTNVHRENDKTTAWFRKNVRDPLSFRGDNLAIVEATIIFRWFNRIESMEIVKDLLLDGWDTEEVRKRLANVSPIVTGAYMMHSPIGYNKLDGMLLAIDWARLRLPKMVASWGSSVTQEQVHRDLKSLDNMGSFSAGEVVWDLRWTPVLWNAPDINTWTVAGPGCARGLGYVRADDPLMFNYGNKGDQEDMLEMMLTLLDESRQGKNWPQEWQPWELHEAEMWACEYAKYRSAQAGGRLKRRF